MNINLNSVRAHADHVMNVQYAMSDVIEFLMLKLISHDSSKVFNDDELPLLQHKYMLDQLDYGSDEFVTLVNELKPAVKEHHYNNSHHIEFFNGNIEVMNLMDLLEMLCDLRAFSLQKNKSIKTMLDEHKERYNLSDELAEILRTTCIDLGWD